jgi:choice-of-anchor B domain-containing protein
MKLRISGPMWLVVAATLAALAVTGEAGACAIHAFHMFHGIADPDALPQKEALSAIPCVGGMAGPYPCKNVDLMSFLPLSTIGGGNGSSLWGWTDPDTGREYAIMGRTTGASFVDITDAANPVFLGNLKSHTGTSTWREMKTYGYYAYIISDQNGNHGMQIFDMRELRNPPTTPQLRESGWYGGFANCHDLAIDNDTGYAYCVGSNTCSGGLHMMSLADPLNPQFAGCFAADGYTHDTQCVVYHGPDVAHQGQEICFASNTDTLTIVDVTDKSAPVMISRTSYPGLGYTHQGWLTADHSHFLIDDELDEMNFGHPTWTYIWNLTDLEAPVLLGHYTGPTMATDHNQYIHNGYSYQANYRAGLRILDVADIAAANLKEVAYFDIYPSSDAAGFNGAWNNYPFFASGNVIVSGIEQGLFVVHPNLPTAVTLTPAKPSLTASTAGLPAGASAVFDLIQVAVPGTSELTLTSKGAATGAYPFTVAATDGVLTWTRDAPEVDTDERLIFPPVTLPAGHTPLTMQFRNCQVLECRARSTWSSAGMAPSWRSPPTT